MEGRKIGRCPEVVGASGIPIEKLAGALIEPEQFEKKNDFLYFSIFVRQDSSLKMFQGSGLDGLLQWGGR